MLTNQLKSSTGVGIHANFSTSTHLPECLPFQAVIAQRVEMTYNADGQLYCILQGVDLLIRQGDIQLLMGPSGSGKTTPKYRTKACKGQVGKGFMQIVN